tara:strand:- start:394147 stop:394863 length:717 start_codon:yes stop_codon:yes gene_type:complete
MRAPLHALLLLLTAIQVCSAEPLRVAVAANFKPTLVTINAAYRARTGQEVLLSSASTGTLYSQILHGAPFSLFFSADRATAQRVSDAPVASDGRVFCYAIGELSLVGTNDLNQLSNPARSLAIANPAIAPYGFAAKQVLQRPEFAAGASRKLIQGNNAAQAYQFWHTGGAELALVPTALLHLAPDGDDAVAVPSTWHEPIEQTLVVIHSDEAVNAYLNWVRSDTVRAIIQRAGYLPCP